MIKGSKTKLELYVEFYLKQKAKYVNASEIRLLKKGRSYIQAEIDDVDDKEWDRIVNLYTYREDIFTRTIEQLLHQIDYSNNRASFQRTIDIINRFINNR